MMPFFFPDLVTQWVKGWPTDLVVLGSSHEKTSFLNAFVAGGSNRKSQRLSAEKHVSIPTVLQVRRGNWVD